VASKLASHLKVPPARREFVGLTQNLLNGRRGRDLDQCPSAAARSSSPVVKAAPYVTGVDRRTVVALVELGIRSLTTGGA